MGQPKGKVNYIDGDIFNIRRSNLFIETPQAIGRRSKLAENNTYGIKGVYWHKKHKNWYTSIRYEGKNHYLGSFNTKEEAQKVRLEAETKYYKPEIIIPANISKKLIPQTYIPPSKRTLEESIHLEDGTTKIPLTQNMWSTIYTKYFHIVKNYTWCATKGTNTYYAITNIRLEDGTLYHLSMHRLLMNDPEGQIVDHKDRDGLNNRTDNLRITDKQGNAVLPSNNTSGVKGVSWQKNRKYCEAHISVNQKKIHLGSFQNKEDAIKAREEAEDKIDPEFFKGHNNG